MAEFDSVIPAGGSGTLTAKVKTRATQGGSVSKAVAVTTSSPEAERLTLSVTFRAVTAITVLPRPLVNLNGVAGEEPSETLILRRPDGEKLLVSDVETTDQRLTIMTTPVTEKRAVGRFEAEPGDVLLEVGIKPGTPAGAANGRIGFTTNHPDARRMDVNYSIRLRPVIEARPAQIRLLLQEGNTPARTMLFRVQHNHREKFKLTSATPSNPELFRVQLVDGADVEQQVHTVAVTLQDDVVPGSLDRPMSERLVLTTDDPVQEEVVVPVVIEPRELRRPAPPRPVE